MTELADRRCVPCRGDTPKLANPEIERLLGELSGWTVIDGHLRKIYRFPDFVRALAFVNRLGAIAEEQGHHPEVLLGWGMARVEIWTHAIDGLSESDFILAAKADRALPA